LSSKAKKPAAKDPKPAKPAVEKAVQAKPTQPSAKPASPPAGGVTYIDATGHIAGRLCSEVASEILRGKRIVVLNAEKAVLSGNRDSVVAQWKQRLELGSKVNPIYGPIHPRKPDNILRRMVRGMVPKTKAKGVEGMKRLRVYIGVPQKYSGVTMTKFEDAVATRPLPMYTTLMELSQRIGWSG